MRNLLRAGLYRLSKDILFWIAVGVSLLVGIIFGLSYRSQSIFDDFFIMPVFLSLGVFISLSVGREYSNGTIALYLVLDIMLSYIGFSLIDYFMDSVSATDISILVLAIIFSLFGIKDVDKKLKNEE